MTGAPWVRLIAATAILAALTGCDDGIFAPLTSAKPTESAASQTGGVEERDVEAPEVFAVREAGLWDGRPSLGGVWAAHPDVNEPERIIIRNTQTDAFVIGALFRKERDTPGPRLQISSDAAEALGMIAGQPIQISVVALRRETVEIAPSEPEVLPEEPLQITEAEAVEITPLDETDVASGPSDSDVIAAAAAAAIAEAEAPSLGPAPTQAPAPAPAPAPAASSELKRPFIQLGIFSVEANANRTGDTMRKIGIVPQILKQTSRGKTFWRVIVGPATSVDERAELLKKIKAEGFSDAYFVTN